MNNETKQIEGFEDYYINSIGDVWSTLSDKFMKKHLSQGYYVIGLTRDKKQYMLCIHKLIAKAFIPNPENKKVVNHINGIKSDNNLKNLEWISNADDQIHAFIVLSKKKKRHLGFKKAQEVKQMYKENEITYVELAKIFNISPQSIGSIIRGETYNYSKEVIEKYIHQ